MFWLEKIKTGHSFIFSAFFHLFIVAILLKIFSSENSNLNFVPALQPVAVMSGSEFEAIKKKFSKNNKKATISKLSKTGDIALSNPEQVESKKGSKNSNLKDGLNLNLKTKESANYDNGYLNIIANKLEQSKSYISMASAPSDVKTKIMMKVKLDENGKLSSYKIIKNSSYNFFNKAAIKILELSAPFPKPPVNFKNALEFDIPIFFDTI